MLPRFGKSLSLLKILTQSKHIFLGNKLLYGEVTQCTPDTRYASLPKVHATGYNPTYRFSACSKLYLHIHHASIINTKEKVTYLGSRGTVSFKVSCLSELEVVVTLAS